MSLKRGELLALVDELRPSLVGATVYSFKSIDTRKYILQVTKKQENILVLICLQDPFLRLHRLSGNVQGNDTAFAKQISGLVIQSIELLNQDRIVSLTFNNQKKLIVELFVKRPNLYLIDANWTIELTLNPVENSSYQLPPNPLQNDIITPDSSVTSQIIEALYAQKEREAAFAKEKRIQLHQCNQRLKRAHKALDKAQSEWEKCNAWEVVQHEGQLLQANMFNMHKGISELVVEDWLADGIKRVIALDIRLEPKEQIAKRFKLSKKLKAGAPFAEKRLVGAREEVKRVETQLKHLEKAETWDALGPVAKPERPSQLKPTPAQPYYVYKSETGLQIWVGKQEQDNDKLTFSLAKGSDWWLHVSDYPGAHVIIKVPKNEKPDAETMQDALQVALAYSKAKDKGEAEITVTQCKYVSRMKRGPPGKVQISKHQTWHARFDPIRFEKIKNRNTLSQDIGRM